MFVADKKFVGGKIYTMTHPGEFAEAAVVFDGKFIFVGSSKEAEEYLAKETIDLDGRCVLPGFTDTHIHLISDCQQKARANLGAARSIAEVLAIMKRHAEKQEDEWLLGANLHMDYMAEGRFPNRYELDEIAADRPIVLFSYCMHAQICNSEAFKRAGIEKGFKPKVEGLVEFFDDGEPNGIIRESTYAEYLSDLAEQNVATKEERKKLLRRYLHDYTKRGITSIQTFSALAEDPLEYIDEYAELEREGKLPLRITINSSGGLDEAYRAISGFGNEKIRIGAKKIFCDGSLNARSAALFEPYSDDAENVGLALYTQEELTERVREAFDFGNDVAIHAIGDRGLDMVISAIEKVLSDNGYSDEGVAAAGALDGEPGGFAAAAARKFAGQFPRFRIIHAMLLKDRTQLERLRRLPVIIDAQPTFLRNWYKIADDRIGATRKQLLFPLRSMVDTGLLLTGGSDGPVEPADPLIGIYAAVTRKSTNGEPEGGFVPEQALSVFEAVAMFTRNAAYCTHEEKIKGTIEEGKFADMVVLGEDIFEVAPEHIADIPIEQVFLGGERVQ